MRGGVHEREQVDDYADRHGGSSSADGAGGHRVLARQCVREEKMVLQADVDGERVSEEKIGYG